MVMHYLNNVSILFADIVGFTKMSSSRSAIEIVSMLNTICDHFDRLVSRLNFSFSLQQLFSSYDPPYFVSSDCVSECDDVFE